jgi:hypothetical protein
MLHHSVLTLHRHDLESAKVPIFELCTAAFEEMVIYWKQQDLRNEPVDTYRVRTKRGKNAFKVSDNIPSSYKLRSS